MNTGCKECKWHSSGSSCWWEFCDIHQDVWNRIIFKEELEKG